MTEGPRVYKDKSGSGFHYSYSQHRFFEEDHVYASRLHWVNILLSTILQSSHLSTFVVQNERNTTPPYLTIRFNF